MLAKTLGVPLFQEQAMKIAIVAAGFTPSEADKLRRAMATFKRVGTIGTFQRKMIDGMLANGYERDFAERCFQQIEGFGEYGFPESHAASFALLVYASAWLKCRYPDAFAAALLNAQPMGFYAPAQIVRDAREHGVEVRRAGRQSFAIGIRRWKPARAPPSVCIDLHRAMRDDIRATHAMRLGLREIKGLSEEDGSFEDDAELIVARRGCIPTTPCAMSGCARGLSPRVLERLADADAFGSLGLTRREALWAAKALGRVGDSDDDLPLFSALPCGSAQARCGGHHESRNPTCAAADASVGRGSGRTRRRPAPDAAGRGSGQRLPLPAAVAARASGAVPARRSSARGILRNETLRTIASGARVRISGLVTCRQRPGSAKGVVFMTIEDESAVANVIVWPKVFERVRPVVLGARYVAVSGRVQAESGVIHVVADELEDLTCWLARLAEHGADIDGLARADEVRRPIEDQREARAARRPAQPAAAADARNAGTGRRPRRHRARLGACADAAGRAGAQLLRHHVAAPDIDAVGFQRAVRLLHRAHDRDMRARLEFALCRRPHRRG